MIIQNSNIRRALVRNRYKILGGIIAIILVLCIIRYLNDQAIKKAQESKNNQNTVVNNTVNIGAIPDNETVISGNDISSKKHSNYTNIINQFIEACNKKQVELAYNMLSKECQEALYNSQIQLFEKNYINRIFNTKKTYSLQSWMNKAYALYQVKIVEDVLATGGGSSKTIEDYYTIIEQDGEYKLNINSYIGREKIESQANKDGISISIKQKEIYREYEVYQIEIENMTQNTILMDSKESAESVYLYGESDEKYPAFLYEVDDSKLIIEPNNKKVINVTFNKRYTSTNRISYMIWNDIILNQIEYGQTVNKKEYMNRMSILVSI